MDATPPVAELLSAAMELAKGLKAKAKDAKTRAARLRCTLAPGLSCAWRVLRKVEAFVVGHFCDPCQNQGWDPFLF